MKVDCMSRACVKHVKEEDCIQNFGGKDKKKETTRKTQM
jgi:hypothetical protein